MKTFEERYPEHNNPEWQIRTWAQEEDLERAKSEHEDFIDLSNKGSLMLFWSVDPDRGKRVHTPVCIAPRIALQTDHVVI